MPDIQNDTTEADDDAVDVSLNVLVKYTGNRDGDNEPIFDVTFTGTLTDIGTALTDEAGEALAGELRDAWQARLDKLAEPA